MQQTGLVSLPLHGGKCPRWLFPRMIKLSKEIATLIINEYGTAEFLQRISDPFFFQSLSCVIGFDWHSSGVTTTTCGALKEALSAEEHGIIVCGGKGRMSRKVPDEIIAGAYKFNLQTRITNNLVRASKMSAKVDTALVQDGYQLYHHTFFIDEKGNWAVVQQGMNDGNGYARRYHWLSDNVHSFVEEPHSAICCDARTENTLNMTAKEAFQARKASIDAVKDGILLRRQSTLSEFFGKTRKIAMPSRHALHFEDLSAQSQNALRRAYDLQPKNYEELVALQGIGPKTIRALALVSELVYGAPASWKDPAKYSFAHGGKDGWPYRINQQQYDKTIEILKGAIADARLGEKEKAGAIRRLSAFIRTD
ncbi:MAG: DUF763 domain-containing protein [Candidatus Woesearchaeota archaeon]